MQAMLSTFLERLHLKIIPCINGLLAKPMSSKIPMLSLLQETLIIEFLEQKSVQIRAVLLSKPMIIPVLHSIAKTQISVCRGISTMKGSFSIGYFWSHMTLFSSCSVAELPRSSKQCVCDDNSNKVKCTDDDGEEYSEGDSFGGDDSGAKCEYLRQDYVEFNEVLGLIDGKDRIYL